MPLKRKGSLLPELEAILEGEIVSGRLCRSGDNDDLVGGAEAQALSSQHRSRNKALLNPPPPSFVVFKSKLRILSDYKNGKRLFILLHCPSFLLSLMGGIHANFIFKSGTK